MGAALSSGKHPLIDSSLVFPAPPSSYSCSSDGLLLLRSRFAAAAGAPAAVPAFLVVPSPQSHLKLAAALRTAKLAAAAAEATAAAAAAASGLPPQQQLRRRSNIEGACAAAAAAAARAATSDEESERKQQLLQKLEQKRKELQQHMLLLQQLHRQQKQQRVLRRRQPRKAAPSHALGSTAAAAEAEDEEGEASAVERAAAAAATADALEAAADSTSSEAAAAADEGATGAAAPAGSGEAAPAAAAAANGSYWDTEASGGRRGSDYCILYFHGNACDANMVRGWLQVVADELGLPILVFEYPGYGLLSGLPSSSAGVDRCAKVALEFLVEQLQFPPEKIILCGRSIGTGPAAYLASRLAKCNLQLGGLVLISPFASLAALAADMAELPEPLARLVVTHHWDTEAALQQCQGLPLCIIHGQQDEIIPVSHSRRLLSTAPNSAVLRVSHLPPHANHSVGLEPAAMKEEVLQPLLLFLRKVRCAARLKRQQQLHHKKHLEAQARRAAAANAAATAVAAAAADSLVGHLQPQVSRLLRERTSCVGRWQSQQQQHQQAQQQQRRLQHSEKTAGTGSVSTRHCIRAPVAARSIGSSSSIKRHHSVEPRLMRPLAMQLAASLQQQQQQQPLVHHRSLRLFCTSRLEASNSSTDDDTLAEKVQQLQRGGAGRDRSGTLNHTAAAAATEATLSEASDAVATATSAAEANVAEVRLPQAFFGDSDGETSPAAAAVAAAAAASADFLGGDSLDSGAMPTASTAASAAAAATDRINAARAFLATEAKIHRRLLLACRHIQQQQRQSMARPSTFFKPGAAAATPAGGLAASFATSPEVTRRLGSVGEAAGAAATAVAPAGIAAAAVGSTHPARPLGTAGAGTSAAGAAAAGRGIRAPHLPAVCPYVKSSSSTSNRTAAAATAAAAAKKFLSRQRLCHSAAFGDISIRKQPPQQQQQYEEHQQLQQQQKHHPQRRILYSRRTIGSSAARAVSLAPGNRFWGTTAQQEH
ncbi:hypothetical protein, conserved [Eimeria acervulina]|uniref:Uncharacterized protein n=1 Tax=Eimeria acervulina TaxID=5801 RepID=U6GFU4_EIMAC|nr:hypothetical protein, conserved [Eimeria acervulina]CDI77459.1 hypothetical protein, conserved [Eimeria acervulina]